MAIPTKKEDFDPRVLRPRVTFRPVFANNVTPALRAKQYGTEAGIGPLDDGALKVVDGFWKIFSTAFEGQWNDFDPDDLGQFSHADNFSAYGAGWSSGGGAFTGHGPTHIGQMFLDQLKREPTPEELQDASYGKDFGLDLRPPAAQPAGPQTPPATPPVPNKPTAPIPPVLPPNPPEKPPVVMPPLPADLKKSLAEIKRQALALAVAVETAEANLKAFVAAQKGK